MPSYSVSIQHSLGQPAARQRVESFLERVLRDYAQNADVLIYASQYTPEEYEAKKGWGHSTWLEAKMPRTWCGIVVSST